MSKENRRARGLGGLVVLAMLLGGVGLLGVEPAHAAPAAPVRSIAVSGTGIGSLSPEFDPAITRYSVPTTEGETGSLTVTASTSDPAGRVQVDGVTVSGATTLTGLSEGDEVSVIISDSSGTTGYALVYLPPDFPDLATSGDTSAAAPGQVLLTLTTFSGSRTFEVALDRNGVPSYFHADASPSATDLKPAPHGHYTVFRPDPVAGRGADLVELDGQFRPVRTMTVGDPLTNTDNHDAIVRADGSHLLMGYEPNPTTGRTDATIQEIDAAGAVVYTWNSADHFYADESTAPATTADYAHINSFEQLPDGDLLVSFRHTSSVMKIAWHAHDGFERGDIVWRLGGRHSDFTFANDPDGGPCAQHAASMLPDGNVLVFDNGSGWPDPNALCVNPADRTGDSIARPHTKAAEYHLDFDEAGDPTTATLVWRYDGPGEGQGFTLFTGSARRLSNGNTLIGWGALRKDIATEVTSAGERVWDLTTTSQFVSYRAAKAVVPDVTPPVVTSTLRDHLTIDAGTRIDAGARCTDLGGSNLVRCAVTSDTSLTSPTPGTHVVRVEAVDGAGNRTVVTRTVAVRSARPVLEVRQGAAWRSARAVTLRRHGARASLLLRLTNDRVAADVLTLHAPKAPAAYRIRYRAGGRDITSAVLAGRWHPRLAGGQSAQVSVRITRTRAKAPRQRVITLRLASAARPSATDTLALRLRSR